MASEPAPTHDHTQDQQVQGKAPAPSAAHDSAHGQRQGPEAARLQGHWLLAKLGKRVLRPGGIELTRQLLGATDLRPGRRIVELGPGVGRTAEILLDSIPASYRGVDPNPEGREQVAAVLEGHPQAEYVVADAASTGLPTGQTDLVVGEAMLTMQSEDAKRAIASAASPAKNSERTPMAGRTSVTPAPSRLTEWMASIAQYAGEKRAACCAQSGKLDTVQNAPPIPAASIPMILDKESASSCEGAHSAIATPSAARTAAVALS